MARFENCAPTSMKRSREEAQCAQGGAILSHPILSTNPSPAYFDCDATQFYAQLATINQSNPSSQIVFNDKYVSGSSGYYIPNDTIGQTVLAALEVEGLADRDVLTKPCLPSISLLRSVHTSEFINSLLDIHTYATWLGLGERKLERFPHDFEGWMNSQLLQVSGSVVAAHLAITRGWSVHLGGGRHHCSFRQPGWYCFFSDITLLIHTARRMHGIGKVLVIDLDTHQGNGFEEDKLHFKDNDTVIIDLFNKTKYPNGVTGAAASPEKDVIDYPVPLTKSKCNTKVYMQHLQAALSQAIADHSSFDLIVFNNGADVLVKDVFRADLNVTAAGLKERDLAVCDFARQHKIPLCMVLSGGYGRHSLGAVARSVCAVVERLKAKPDHEKE